MFASSDDVHNIPPSFCNIRKQIELPLEEDMESDDDDQSLLNPSHRHFRHPKFYECTKALPTRMSLMNKPKSHRTFEWGPKDRLRIL